MKYKLIKKYPGVPDYKEEGDIVDKCYLGYKDKSGYIYHPKEVENYPEFWERVNEEYEVLEEKYPTGITKIKRLSDGSVFCVGDLIVICGIPTKIKRFKDSSDGLMIIHGLGGKHLEHAVAKKSILTTEDGVDIYDKNTNVYLAGHTLDFLKIQEKAGAFDKKWDENWKYFASKKARDNYVIDNKICLCFNDVKDLITFCTVSNDLYNNRKKFRDLVKSKI